MTESREFRRSDGWVSSPAWPVEVRQFLVERLIEQFVPMIAQEHEEFRVSYAHHKLLFLREKVR